jgi:16S rRNA (guanine966-N2)-methyltransferase
MRIIAGEFRGRRLAPPPDGRVRPTADRVREAWFSILASAIHEARVVDLYAGSGALGLEALSRGAAHATFVELATASLRTLRANIAALGLEGRALVRRAEVLRYVERLAPSAFDVAFADPPYSTGHAATLRDQFRARPFARILGIEHQSELDLAGDTSRRYGNVTITFFYAP